MRMTLSGGCLGALYFGVLILSACRVQAVENLARSAQARASSVLESPRYQASNAIDGNIDDGARWISRQGSLGPEWLELIFPETVHLGGVHLYSGYQDRDPIRDFELQYLSDGVWQTIPSAVVEGNESTALRIPFDAAVDVLTRGIRLYVADPEGQPLRVKELKVWPADAHGIPLLAEAMGTEQMPLIYLNQSGFNRGEPKRFTAPLMKDGTGFHITVNGRDTILYQGRIQGHIGDFSDFEPNDAVEYVVHAEREQSVPFRIGNWWLERVSYPGMIDFMVDSRHYLGNYKGSCIGSFGWRDDHHFAYELNTLVPMLLSNPDAYERMPSQIDYEPPTGHPGNWGALEPYPADAPDLVKLIHWGADVIVSQQARHMMLKEQLAFFLYAWPVLKKWLPDQNYELVKAYARETWEMTGIDRDYRYDETSENHNLLEVKKTMGTTKGGNPPGHSILPNLLMYAVAMRDGDAKAEAYFDAAYKQTDWLIRHLDWEDPLVTKGQRMSEHVTMTSLAAMLQLCPDRAPVGLRAKINDWAQVVVARSDNMWDFRKLSEDQWVPTGERAQHWNEPGNVMGFPACLLAAMPYVDSDATRTRLNELVWSHFDNCFGRNPTGRHFSYDAPREIEGVEYGWYSYHEGGIGQLANARFVFDGAPKNQHYPYHPEVGNVGWSEGWVSFNTAYNLSMSYLARAQTELEADYQSGVLSVRLKAPINFDYELVEQATVRLWMMDGSERQMVLKEESPDSAYLYGRIALDATPHSVAYGYGYFEVRERLPSSKP